MDRGERDTQTLNNQKAYSVPAGATRALESLVDRIEAGPGDLIDRGELLRCQDTMDVAGMLAHLPATVTESDFVGILKLALLTESATDTYAATIDDCADRFDAAWLRRFTDKVWTPDESTHFLPYKLILLSLGFNEAELDGQIQETRERQYIHYGGSTPVHMTTFGMIQEYLTDNWHGLIGNLLEGSAPAAASVVRKVKRRETLHAVWYRDMTALQVEANPRFVDAIAEQIHEFHMPSMSLVPDLQSHGMRWQQSMGADFERNFRDLFRYVQETLGNPRLTGQLVLRLAAIKKINVGPVSSRLLDASLRRIGGPGYGIVGEAALQRVGLGYMFERSTERQDSAFAPYSGIHEKVRALVRDWIAERLPPPAQTVLGQTR